jgi:RNA polymerase sigma factor (sigma-70 family)
LFEKYAKATKKEKEQLKPKIIMQYYNMILGLSKKYSFKLFSREDVFNECVIAFDKCIDKFKVENGVRFYTYAYRCIGFEMLNFYYKHNDIIRIPEQTMQKSRRVSKALDKGLTLEQIQEQEQIKDCTMRIIEESLTKFRVLSLDYNIDNDKKKALQNIIAVEQEEEPPQLLHYIDRLADRERIILEMIYRDGLNQNEISEKLGYTRQNISLIKIKGMKNLKKIIKKELNK